MDGIEDAVETIETFATADTRDEVEAETDVTRLSIPVTETDTFYVERVSDDRFQIELIAENTQNPPEHVHEVSDEVATAEETIWGVVEGTLFDVEENEQVVEHWRTHRGNAEFRKRINI